ncbi:MAG: YjbH domain-containing protein [Cypionkella sp.]|uniref:YjbH domain-containing protein n=1 Tax=Cypionkella sp. TaxID=2811411 RepID=UPI002AB9B7B7|nr:YjbH domain-containing protein [Cypionkella sp.]MDZ4309643.1 YjbH domain-containing protein [Cypionkella sp.]
MFWRKAALSGVAALGTVAAWAEEMPALSFYGVPGYVEMPSAFSLPDGTLALSVNRHDGNVTRGNLVFQITPRVTGTFRYSYLQDFRGAGNSLYDRSFDLRFRFVDEVPSTWRPSVAVGFQDFGGTGVFGAEYLVASKHFGPKITASAGIGWGRFGSYGSFRNPLSVFSDKFDNRRRISGIEETGRVGFDRFFRGEAALFLAMDWQATDRMRLSVEYSSDAMKDEVAQLGFEHRTPINIGLEYRLKNGGVVDLAVLNGSAVSLGFSMTLNPARPAAPSGREPAPPAIMSGSSEAAASWGPLPGTDKAERLEKALAAQGLRLDGLRIEGDTAMVAVTNLRWPAAAQAWGRTMRVLSAELPAEVQTFRVQSQVKGMAVTDLTMTRADLEALEFAPDGAWLAFVRAGIADPAALPDPRISPDRVFDYRLRPYVANALFDPDNPLRVDTGLELRGEWSPTPGLYFSGALRHKLIGNLDSVTRESNSQLPHVRSDSGLYARGGDTVIPYLTAEYFTHPRKNLYGRLSFGLLERMYGGASAELLWAPENRRYAMGLDVNYVTQRDYDGIGFLDYSVGTGHLSGYYEFGEGYLGQIDVGRYLAGDWGATFSLTRRFGNGFEVGAFFTLTDVGFEKFGEGSFDKGVTISVPLHWLIGQPSREKSGMTIRPVLRDGGAKLSSRNRLYELIRDDRDAADGDRWGRFWR